LRKTNSRYENWVWWVGTRWHGLLPQGARHDVRRPHGPCAEQVQAASDVQP
jgi:hypothetical protein